MYFLATERAKVDLPHFGRPNINSCNGYFLARFMISSIKGLLLSDGSYEYYDKLFSIIELIFFPYSSLGFRYCVSYLIQISILV